MSLSWTPLPSPGLAPALVLRLHRPGGNDLPPLPAMLGALGTEERLRASRTMVGGVRVSFVTGRYLLRVFAAELLGVDEHRLTTSYSCPTCGPGRSPLDHGRPGYTLDGVPVPLRFSLSRALGLTVLAALPAELGHHVGVDLESVHAVAFAGFDAVSLTPSERAVAADLPTGDGRLLRTRLWARKEALVKALGTGFGEHGPDTFDVLDDPRVTDVDLALEAGWSVRRGPTGAYSDDELVAAVAVVTAD